MLIINFGQLLYLPKTALDFDRVKAFEIPQE